MSYQRIICDFKQVRFRSGLAVAMFALSASGAAAQVTTDSTTRSTLGAVVVSATRTEQAINTLPSHVSVMGAPAIAASPAQTVPDLLRKIPGFTTRDFQSGLVIGPSQSIVSFRGLGGSSAGRTIILLDGLPAGDPFSGWIDWGRIPLPLLQSAEVVRGGGSPIWGSRALGGVVNMRTVQPTKDEARMIFEGGSNSTYHTAGAGSVRRDKVTATVAGDFWNTEGFVLLREQQAGPVDEPSGRTSRALTAKVTYDATSALQLWIAGGVYDGGDLPYQQDDYESFDDVRTGARWVSARGGIATAALFANRRGSIGQSFTVNATRTTRTLSRYQDAPADSRGISLQWTQMAFAQHELTAGADLSSASGSLFESFNFVNNVATQRRDVGGTQMFSGLFVQDAADLGHGLRLLASVRADQVRNTNGRRTLFALPGETMQGDTAFTDRTTKQLSYSAGLRWQQAQRIAWRGSVYESFRAPSMYEMYQPRFSPRGTITEANAALERERLRGAELGADLTLGNGFVARLTAFRNHVTSPIMDVTVATAGAQPTPIPPCGTVPARQACGQRQNVDGLQSNGVEAELDWRPSALWTLDAGYSYSPTRVSAPGKPQDGKWAIRSARHAISTSVGFDHPRWLGAAIEGRYVGSRFDNDLNTIELAEFYLVGLRLNRALGRGMTAQFKIENLLNEAFETTRTSAGIAEMGAPRWVTAGIRAAW
jgi:outer membrane cobalamin receptor